MNQIKFSVLILSTLMSSMAFGVRNEEVVDLGNQISLLLEENVESLDREGKRKIFRSLRRTLNLMESEGISPDGGSVDKVVCVATGTFDRTVITRISDGVVLGSYFDSPQECRSAVKSQKGGLICTPTGTFDRTIITRISDGATIGDYLDSLKQCVGSL